MTWRVTADINVIQLWSVSVLVWKYSICLVTTCGLEWGLCGHHQAMWTPQDLGRDEP